MTKLQRIAFEIATLEKQIIESKARIMELRVQARAELVDSGNLTSREREVMLLVKNLSNKEIADKLGIGVRTVKMHIGNILCKFDVHSRTELPW